MKRTNQFLQNLQEVRYYEINCSKNLYLCFIYSQDFVKERTFERIRKESKTICEGEGQQNNSFEEDTSEEKPGKRNKKNEKGL